MKTPAARFAAALLLASRSLPWVRADAVDGFLSEEIQKRHLPGLAVAAILRIEVKEEEVLQATASRPLNFPPGERWAYSNTNYHLLAMIIRKLSGQWHGDFLRERIFVPLGMTDTRAASLDSRLGFTFPNRAPGKKGRSRMTNRKRQNS